MAFESSGQGDLDDGVSELEDIAKVSFSCNLEFELNNKQNQNLAVGKRDVNGYKSDSPPPAEQGSLKIVGSLLSNLKLEDESSVLSSHDKNGFMSENDIQALSANSYDGNRPLTRMTGEENQMVSQRFQSGLYDSQCQSLFSIPPGHHFYQSTNNSSELQDSQRERLRHPASMSPDQPADDLARILNGGHGASADLLQEDDELRSKSSTSSSLFHHASQTFSDQFLNAPETACFGTSTFSGQETTPFVASRAGTSQRETHGTMPIYNASDALENMWRIKTHEVQPIRRPSSTSNLPLEGSQVFCNASSGTADISDIGVTASDISQDHPIQSQIHSGANYRSSGQFDMPSHPNSTWENQLINIYLSNVNIPKINNGYESDSLISGIGRPEALLNGISYDTALNSDRKSSGFPPVEASKMQRLDFLCHAVSQYEKHPHGGEGLANDIERTNIQGRSLFQSQEMQMTYLHDNTAAAGLNVHPLRTDFKMTSGNFMGLQKAYLEQTLLAQQIQQHESYLSNFINECQLNPSYGIGLHYGEHPMGNSMTHSVNGSRNHILHYRRVSHSRNGKWHPDAAAKSGGRLQTSFLEEMKINKIYCFGLPDIVGHVAEFSSDQRGSRLIQKKLEIASEEHKNLIFPEISLHARELMTDVFGNYVIQKFLECGTTSQRRELVDQISGRVLILSLHMYGCRVIQKTLDVADVDQTSKIVAELGGAVIKCVHDQNGNHVIQKCIESIPENRIQSIMTTFYGQVAALSTHPYGCRVIQRVLEHCADQKSREMVFHEILESVIMLAQNQYGNYVVQRLLLHGKPHERSAIIRKLVGHIVSMSQQKYASNVIEMCLENCSPHDRQLLVNEVLLRSAGEMEPLQVMMQDQYGNYVVQKILKTCTDKDLAPILSRIKLHLKSLNKYPYGKNIVSRIEKLVATGERRIALSSLYK